MGGRPAKPAAVSSGKIGKDNRAARAAAEETLRGSSDRLTPPEWFSDRQAEVFSFVLKEMEASGILGNVDLFILTQFSIAVDRLETIERQVNAHSESLWDKDLMATKAKYMHDFTTGLRELSLSPQARAKLAGMTQNQAKKEADPVLRVLERKGRASGA